MRMFSCAAGPWKVPAIARCKPPRIAPPRPGSLRPNQVLKIGFPPFFQWYKGKYPLVGFKYVLPEIPVDDKPGDVTRILYEMKEGNHEAEDRLIPIVYKELRRIAAAYLRREAPGHSLQPTALVHEAYLRLTHMHGVDWQSRSHFFAVSATVMRRILVDRARAQHSKKRGDGWNALSLDNVILPSPERAPEIIALDQALKRLSQVDERQSKIVELRFFAGMSEEEIGEVLGISPRTVKRDWRVARAWLYDELNCSA